MRNKILLLPFLLLVECHDVAFDGFGPGPESTGASPTIGVTDKTVQCTTDSQCGDPLICYKEDPHNYVGVCRARQLPIRGTIKKNYLGYRSLHQGERL